MSAPRPYHHGDLPRTLLDTAAELVVEDGVMSWSLREVARRAGVSHAAPAHHFGDKAGLIRALATEGFEELGAALAAADDDPGIPVIDRWRASALAYVTFATTRRGHFEVMFRTELFEIDDDYVAAGFAAYGSLRRLVVEMLGDGAPAGDLEDVTLMCWSMVHGLSTLANVGMLGAMGPAHTRSVPDAVAATCDVLLDGIRARQRG